MKKYLDLLVKVIFAAVIVAVLACSIYGLVMLGKTLSYKWLYEEQVKQTITEMDITKVIELKDCYHYPSKIVTCTKCGTEMIESGEKCR